MVGRKIRKAYRGRQVPHGKQSVRKLMAHGTATNSIELSGDAKSFDRVARKWNVDYAVLQEAVVPISVSVRPIEPQGKLIGFASVNFGGVVIDDFKVVDGKNGIFLGAPSKPDPASRTGYRATVRIPDRATQERINAAGVEAYHAAVEQLVARAQAVRPAPIKEQMAEAAKQAGKENAARPAPAKAKEARNDR